MARCHFCNEKFHTCNSCGLTKEEWNYCSQSCYKKDGSPTYCFNCELKAPINKNLLCFDCLMDQLKLTDNPKIIVWINGVGHVACKPTVMDDSSLSYLDTAGIVRSVPFCDWEVENLKEL